MSFPCAHDRNALCRSFLRGARLRLLLHTCSADAASASAKEAIRERRIRDDLSRRLAPCAEEAAAERRKNHSLRQQLAARMEEAAADRRTSEDLRKELAAIAKRVTLERLRNENLHQLLAARDDVHPVPMAAQARPAGHVPSSFMDYIDLLP